MPILLGFLSSEHSWATQTSAGDFLKAIITISANASQNEQSCIGPNELTRQLVSKDCVEKLISDMLKGGNPLTVGVGIVIEVIRKNNSDYDPEVGLDANNVPSSRDPIYLGNLLRMFSQRVPDFMDLILSPNHTIGSGDGSKTIRRKELNAAFGGKIEPLGFDRFKTCELMAELLHCSNMGLLNEIGSEEYIRSRDQERERLKIEGELNNIATSAIDDDLTMKSSTQTRPDSTNRHRRLEVQNSTDDDGFEEVTHSTDLGDDSKDDFDEKLDMDDLLADVKPVPLSFVDKDDEEFVDEPLGSPSLSQAPPQLADSDLVVAPLSPTKDLLKKVDTLDLETMHAPMSSKTPSPDLIDVKDSSPEVEHTKAELVKAVDQPQSQIENEKTSEPTAAELAVEHAPLEEPLLHPEDKPAPLFVKKTELVESKDPTTTTDERRDLTKTDLDEAVSVLHPNSDVVTQSDEPVNPVVGDFLKMQFVDHRVVPTILVSNTHLTAKLCINTHRTSFSGSHGTTSFTM